MTHLIVYRYDYSTGLTQVVLYLLEGKWRCYFDSEVKVGTVEQQ